MNSRDAAYEEEQLRRAIEESKREGGALGTATGRRKGKRSRSESEESVLHGFLGFACVATNIGYELTGTGVTKAPSANGLPQVLLPRPLKARVVAVRRTRKMKSRSPRNPKISEAQQLETTGTKNFEIAKLNEKKNAQMHLAAEKAVQKDGEAMVLYPESSPSHPTLLMLSIHRVRSFASTALADRLCPGHQHHQRPFRCPRPSRSPATQDRTEEDRATTGEARSCWKESIH